MEYKDKKSVLKGVMALNALKYTLKSHPVNLSDWLYAIGLQNYIPAFTFAGYEELNKATELTPLGILSF